MELHVADNGSLRLSPSSYVMMPTTCSRKVMIDRTRRRRNVRSTLVTLAKKDAGSPSNGLQKELKKDLSRMLWTEAAVEAVERKAGSKKYKNLWPKAVLEALDEAIKEAKWESALKIFGLLRKQHWYQPRIQTYTKLLMMLGKCRKAEQAGFLFEVMISDGLRPSLDVYTALVSAYGLSGFFDQAFSTIEDMKSASDCKPDIYTYSVLINCCIKHRRFDLIDQTLSDMSYMGVQCNTVAYNTIIDGYGKAKLFELMELSLTEMIESGTCLPDVFTLNSCIWAYGNCGQIEKMEKWYEEFQLMGIRPDIRTLNVLIRSYGKAGLFGKMEYVLEFMKKRFVSPTVVTYNTIIERFGLAGDIEKMDDFFLKMKHQGMKPNAITYCSLVNAYFKAGKLYRVDSILRQVENSDVVLDTPFFNCVINAYGRVGDVDKMTELFLLMKGRSCQPDHITFATMIRAYNAQGMTEAAQDMESKMLSTRQSSAFETGKESYQRDLVIMMEHGLWQSLVPKRSSPGIQLISLGARDDGGSNFEQLSVVSLASK